MTNIRLLTAAECIVDATKHIKTAKKRIAVVAMVVADHPATHSFFEALLDSAEALLEEARRNVARAWRCIAEARVMLSKSTR